MFVRLLPRTTFPRLLVGRLATSKKPDLPALRNDLFERYKEYRPWHSVRVLHTLTMAHHYQREAG